MAGKTPPKIQADFAVLSAAVKAAAGKSDVQAGLALAQSSVVTAIGDIGTWIEANCGG